MKSSTAWVLGFTLFVILALGSMGIGYQYQVSESQYEKCIENCYYALVDDTLELECVSNCLQLVNCTAEDLSQIPEGVLV